VAIPPEVNAAAEEALREFCLHHSAAAISDRLRYSYKLADSAAVLLEERPGFLNPDQWTSRPIARFRYSPAKGEWGLYWANADERWRRLSSAPPAKDVRKLLQIVADNPSGVFTR
jgi:hypothetical protein